MAAKNAEQLRKIEVEQAIRSLRDLFPSPKYGECSRVATKSTMAIQAKINARKAILAKDKELVKLEAELHALRCKVFANIKANQAKVDALLRRLNLRGVNDKLVADIEALAASGSSELIECDCD